MSETAEAFVDRVQDECIEQVSARARDCLERNAIAMRTWLKLQQERECWHRAEARREALQQCLTICINVINRGRCTLEVERCLEEFRSLLSVP